jgi:hypothetical protein
MSNRKLEGSVEKDVIVGYVWHAEGDSCDECQELDGQVFDTEDEIPDPPHPNCDCYVEEIYQEVDEYDDEDTDGDPDEDGDEESGEELCNCDYYVRLEEYVDEIDKMIGDSNSLKDEVEAEISDIECFIAKYSDIDSDDIARLLLDLNSLMNPLQTLFWNITYFSEGWFETVEVEREKLDAPEADKYYHAKANCQSAQLGILGSKIAEGLGNLKEYADYYRYVYVKGKSIKETIEMSAEDQKANKEGRELGRKYPTKDPDEILKHRIPENLPEGRW